MISRNPPAKTSSRWMLFFGVFAYIIIMGLLLQLVLLPKFFPQMHAGEGLLIGLDSIRYHRLAVEKAGEILAHGWSAWELSPRSYTPAGVASALYVLIAPKPWTFLLVNALLKGISAVALCNISFKLFRNQRIGLYSTIPFVLFPSGFTWDLQILNDGFTIAGTFLLIDGLLSLIKQRPSRKIIDWPHIEILVGTVLYAIVRSYYLILFLPIPIFALSIAIWAFRKKPNKKKITALAWNAAFISIVIVTQFFLGLKYFESHFSAGRAILERLERLDPEIPPLPLGGTENDELGSLPLGGTENDELGPLPLGGTENDEPELAGEKTMDDFLTSLFYPLIRARSTFISKNPGETALDNSINLESWQDVLTYLPRALQIALFSPFPNIWFSTGTSIISFAMRSISGVEMIFYYLALPVFGLALLKNRGNEQLLFLSASILLNYMIMGIVIVNIGALFRFRFPFFMLIITTAFAYWLSRSHRLRLSTLEIDEDTI